MTRGTPMKEVSSVRADMPTPNAREFFKLNASYTISAEASLGDLAGDLSCLLASGVAVFEESFEGLSQAQWAGLYMLRQAMALWAEVDDRTRRLPGYKARADGRHD